MALKPQGFLKPKRPKSEKLSLSVPPGTREKIVQRMKSLNYRKFSDYFFHLIQEDFRMGGPHVKRPQNEEGSSKSQIED